MQVFAEVTQYFVHDGAEIQNGEMEPVLFCEVLEFIQNGCLSHSWDAGNDDRSGQILFT